METYPSLKQKKFFKSCIKDKISKTLYEINSLKTPVSRTCHIGNNTSNNWGFLALAKNAQLLQYDHTLYGMDENCMPWVVLGNNGLINMCYDHTGMPVLEEVGKHINVHLQSITDTKYTRHLNYGLSANFNNMDLINYHFNVANKISNHANGRDVTFNTKEILSIKNLMRSIIKDFAKNKLLDVLFSFWVKKSKKNYIMRYRIGEIQYLPDNIIRVFTTEGSNVFSGPIDSLCDCFFSNIQHVHDKIVNIRPLEEVNYPWVDLHFNYVLASIKEFHLDNQQKKFWHAGGSASQYYTNDDKFNAKINRLIEHLIFYKYLPVETQIYLIPTFCCQLFATNQSSLTILEELVHSWVVYKNKNSRIIDGAVQLLSEANHPLSAIKETFEKIDADIIIVLKNFLSNFNEEDINKLPVAHISSYTHSSYNKFGVSQNDLMGKEFYFPPSFYELTWGEAELLVKILGEIVISEYQ